MGWRWRRKKNQQQRALCPQHNTRRKARKEKPVHCTYPKCTDPIFAPPDKVVGKGRPTTKCEKHYLKGKSAKEGCHCKMCGAVMVFFGTKVIGAPPREVNVWHCDVCGASKSRKRR